MLMKKFVAISFTLLISLPAAFLSTHSIKGQEKDAPRYEMTTYYVAFLYRGPKWTPKVTEEIERLQEAHMANIRKMAESGKLILAGPFSDDGNLRGMFVFQVASMEEAKALADHDPAVMAGRLAVELHPWFSAKGIRVNPPKKE